MSKFNTLFAVTLLLSIILAHGARPDPKLISDSVVVKAEKAVAEESCAGVGEDECLSRRTLAAHLDYIYTEGDTPPMS